MTRYYIAPELLRAFIDTYDGHDELARMRSKKPLLRLYAENEREFIGQVSWVYSKSHNARTRQAMVALLAMTTGEPVAPPRGNGTT